MLAKPLLPFALFAAVSTTTQAEPAPIQDFRAQFSVEAYGFNLGVGEQSFHCQNNECTLMSSARPQGAVRLFFKDESYETIKLKRIDNQLLWQSYYKQEIRYKGGSPTTVETRLMRKDGQIINPDKSSDWPASDQVFDPISMPYAIRWRLLHNQPLEGLLIQDNKAQHPLQLRAQKETQLQVEFADKKQPTLQLDFVSHNHSIRLWLLTEQQLFPAKIRITNNQKDQSLTLNLVQTPIWSTPIEKSSP